MKFELRDNQGVKKNKMNVLFPNIFNRVSSRERDNTFSLKKLRGAK